jgi:hypothetical protein
MSWDWLFVMGSVRPDGATDGIPDLILVIMLKSVAAIAINGDARPVTDLLQ